MSDMGRRSTCCRIAVTREISGFEIAGKPRKTGAMLDLIGQELKRHEKDTLNENGNWGRLGELKYVHGRLSEILITLIGGKDCQQAAKMIREHLDTIVGEDA